MNTKRHNRVLACVGIGLIVLSLGVRYLKSYIEDQAAAKVIARANFTDMITDLMKDRLRIAEETKRCVADWKEMTIDAEGQWTTSRQR